MKYTIDEIINDKVRLIDVKTGNKKYVSIDVMPDEIEENDVVIYENGSYYKDSFSKEERLDTIKKKIDILKNINN